MIPVYLGILQMSNPSLTLWHQPCRCNFNHGHLHTPGSKIPHRCFSPRFLVRRAVMLCLLECCCPWCAPLRRAVEALPAKFNQFELWPCLLLAFQNAYELKWEKSGGGGEIHCNTSLGGKKQFPVCVSSHVSCPAKNVIHSVVSVYSFELFSIKASM